jgi:hypothetical protein
MRLAVLRVPMSGNSAPASCNDGHIMQATTQPKEDAHLPDTHVQKQGPVLIDVSGSRKSSKICAASNNQGWAKAGEKL